MEPINQAPLTIFSKSPKKSRIPTTVKVGLLIFLLASAVVLTVFPNLAHRQSSPPFVLFALSGLVMVIFTSLFFLYLNKLNLGFGRMALVLAFGYNAVIAVIKITLSPNGLYLANKNRSFDTQLGDPNTGFYYLLVAVAILILYIGFFSLMYRHFVKRAGIRNNPHTTDPPPPGALTVRKVLTMCCITVAVMALGGGIILLPLLIFSPTILYIGYIFSTLGVPLIVALGIAILLAYSSFAAVERQVIVSGNATLLASFFWIGVSLIVLYHIMWIIIMLTLVHIWPFNTYTSK